MRGETKRRTGFDFSWSCLASFFSAFAACPALCGGCRPGGQRPIAQQFTSYRRAEAGPAKQTRGVETHDLRVSDVSGGARSKSVTQSRRPASTKPAGIPMASCRAASTHPTRAAPAATKRGTAAFLRWMSAVSSPTELPRSFLAGCVVRRTAVVCRGRAAAERGRAVRRAGRRVSMLSTWCWV